MKHPLTELRHAMIRDDGTIYMLECCSCGKQILESNHQDRLPTRADENFIRIHAETCVDLKRDCADPSPNGWNSVGTDHN